MSEKPTDQSGDPAKPNDSSLGLKERYQAVTQHWTHSEQIRWQLLYNFLVASSILILAWATVFASNVSSAAKSPVLFALCGIGFVLSILWTALGLRASGFVNMYTGLGLSAEILPPKNDLPLKSPNEFPFHKAAEYREQSGIKLHIDSRLASWATPAMFLLLYVALFIIYLVWGGR